MNDIDQQIRAALDAVVSVAPPPVPVEAIPSANRQSSAPRKIRHWSWALAVPATAALAWVTAVNVTSFTDSDPSPPIELETVDRSPNEPAPQPDVPSPEERFTAIEGRWLSEMVPNIAGQLPKISQEQLWSALESTEPQPPFSSLERTTEATEVPGLSDSQLRWEGLLFPSTYSIGQGDDAVDAIAKLHNEFLRATEELGYEESFERVGLSPYEVVVVASLVEAEAFTDEDRGRIARVIHNRLAEGIPLSIDAPYFYAAQDRQLRITRSVLETPGPYGLRVATGLPPTPISSPGRASLRAAINPTEGPWLFYTLADEQGNHAFATTLEEHHANLSAARQQDLLD